MTETVELCVASLAFNRIGSVNDHIENEIETQRNEMVRERVDALLIEGLSSGPGVEVTPEYWQQRKEELTRKHLGPASRQL